MTRVALLSSEPLRERMAGIGIRYLEMARTLAAEDIEVVLLSPSAVADPAPDPEVSDVVGEVELGGVEIGTFDVANLAESTAGCSVVVAQGQLANESIHRLADLPQVVDLYDPWLIENLHYARDLGTAPYRNDHQSWVLQMSAGDFFLCSSEEQRLFYLGFLTALGRINPESIAEDPDFERLIAVAPFGQPEELPPYTPVLEGRREGELRLLFGGLYDWYDPWPLLSALESLDWRHTSLFFVTNPNPGNTPQRLLAEVERWCRQRGWWQTRVRTLDWVPYERRYDLLRDFDALVATHRPGLETRLSMRTRFLDALRVGVPVVISEGGAVSRMVKEVEAGWVVPASSPKALATALREILDPARAEKANRDQAVERGLELARELRWRQALAPLVEFCRDPRIDDSKRRFVHSIATEAPRDGFLLRVRRKLSRAGGVRS